MQILRVCFFLDVRICVLVHSKIKPSCTELSITSALKSAKTRTNLRVSSISIFWGSVHALQFCATSALMTDNHCNLELTSAGAR